MATPLIRSPELNATNNLLESFKGLYDVMVNPSATSMKKQAAFSPSQVLGSLLAVSFETARC